MEGYLGQRSQGPKCSLESSIGPEKEETQEYDVGCFQSVCSFILSPFEMEIKREKTKGSSIKNGFILISTRY